MEGGALTVVEEEVEEVEEVEEEKSLLAFLLESSFSLSVSSSFFVFVGVLPLGCFVTDASAVEPAAAVSILNTYSVLNQYSRQEHKRQMARGAGRSETNSHRLRRAHQIATILSFYRGKSVSF